MADTVLINCTPEPPLGRPRDSRGDGQLRSELGGVVS